MIGTETNPTIYWVFVKRGEDYAKPWTVHTDETEARESRDACIREGFQAWIYFGHPPMGLRE